MPKGKKIGGRDFVKGDPRCNRNGRPKITEEQLAIRNNLAGEISVIINMYQSLPVEDLKSVFKDKKKPALHLAVIKTMIKSIETGDFTKYLEPMLTRSIGKPKENISLDAKLSLGERREMRDSIRKDLTNNVVSAKQIALEEREKLKDE